MMVTKHNVQRILVDSSMMLQRMKLSLENLKKVYTPLTGFFANSVNIKGKIPLLVTVGQQPRQEIV